MLDAGYWTLDTRFLPSMQEGFRRAQNDGVHHRPGFRAGHREFRTQYLESSIHFMPARTSFRTLFIILGYVAGVLIVAALLAPVLFFTAQSVMQHSPDSTLSQVLADKDFAAYFSRAAMLAAISGLVPLLR